MERSTPTSHGAPPDPGSMPDSSAPPATSAALHLSRTGADALVVVHRDGQIIDAASDSDQIALAVPDGPVSLQELCAPDSRQKVEAMLEAAVKGEPPRWREINLAAAHSHGAAVRCRTLSGPAPDTFLVLFRSNQQAAALQQRLLSAQQALERDYDRLTEAQMRYKALFHHMDAAVLLVDVRSRMIVDANAAAQRMLGSGSASGLIEAALPERWRSDIVSLIAAARAAVTGQAGPAVLEAGETRIAARVSVFRAGGQILGLIGLSPHERPTRSPVPSSAESSELPRVLDNTPDSIVVTAEDLTILGLNQSFLDLTGLAGPAQALGRPLSGWLGRPGLDRDLIADHLARHGEVIALPTLIQAGPGHTEAVEVSAGRGPGPVEGDSRITFVIRRARRSDDATAAVPDIMRSPSELAAQVGRGPLKDIIREATDVIERLCIERALQLTSNNRASAAEVLGLSRQSLYSKLHRHGLAGLDED